MAEFIGHLRNLKPSFPEVNANVELTNDITVEAFGENNIVSVPQGFAPLPRESYNDHLPTQFSVNPNDDIQPLSEVHGALSGVPVPATALGSAGLKSDISARSSSHSHPVFGGNNKNLGGRKRKRINENEVEKPKEVVHVRAKRGQATDSHSLAERVRREKINERLRCLQELVPGCYKTMGMAVMLDVIINYVQSLQNQIEFLSMKLSAASMFYDFNLEHLDAAEAMQARNAYEAEEMEKLATEEYGTSLSQFPST